MPRLMEKYCKNQSKHKNHIKRTVGILKFGLKKKGLVPSFLVIAFFPASTM